MLRQRRRRNPFDKGEEGRRRRSENDEEEEEGDSDDVFFVLVFSSFWRGRDQRLCRGCWRRLRSNFLSSSLTLTSAPLPLTATLSSPPSALSPPGSKPRPEKAEL